MAIALPVAASAAVPGLDTGVLLLCGQSNMVPSGRTVVTPTTPEDAKIVITSDRFTLSMNGGDTTATGGLGLPMGRALALAGHGRVGILGCAMSGSNITAWQKGQTLYDTALASALATGYPVLGLMFLGGETDARDDGYTPADGTLLAPDRWADYFRRFVQDMRRDLAQPGLRVVYGRIAHNTTGVHGNWERVQAQQDALAMGGVAYLDPEPISLLDGIHWLDADYERVGPLFVDALLALP